MKLTYLITVKQTVPFYELTPEDQDDRPTGEYEYDAEDEEEALDEFHETIPIKCLDDFEITCVARVAAEVENDIRRFGIGFLPDHFNVKKIYAPEPHEYVDEMEPEESDMADIRNYEELDPDCKFTLDIIEVMDALHEGKKVQCSEWDDSEYIYLDKREDIVDENDREMSGSVLIMNRIFNWRIIE